MTQESNLLAYFDNNATTPVVSEVVKEMSCALHEDYGNPSSTHFLGKQASELMKTARRRVASFLKTEPDNIIFTSGGTESTNLAILGTVKKLERRGHFITSNVEHPAVLEALAALERDGHRITYLPVNSDGAIEPAQLEDAICHDSVLATFMMANNETGVIFPVAQLARVARKRGVLFHCDAVQGAGRLPINLNELPVDLLSISGHKIHGPKGVGVLFVREPELVSPMILGGGQEQGKRSGTEAVPAIVGMGKACEILDRDMAKAVPHIAKMRNALEAGVLRLVPGSRVNGGKVGRLCNTSSIVFPGVHGQELVDALSAQGICVSRGSACSTCHGGGSHVLRAMGLTANDADSTIRFSLSKENARTDVDRLLEVLPTILKGQRRPAGEGPDTKNQCQTCRVVAAGAIEFVGGSRSFDEMVPGLSGLRRTTLGDSKVCVAILDGAVDVDHPCFEGADLTRVESLVPGSRTHDEFSRHGTHVASILFGQPGTVVTGISPACKGLILPIFREVEGRILPCSQLELAHAINSAVEAGAQVINISGGQFEEDGEASVFLARAIELCVKSGVLVVAAAGNDGCDCHHVPASLPGVLAVGAMNRNGKPLAFSNWGKRYREHGILAIGEDIPGAIPRGGSSVGTGTSYAAPLVTGVIALMMSIQHQRGEEIDPYAVRDALLRSAVPCDPHEEDECGRFLAGRLHVGRAMEQLFSLREEEVFCHAHADVLTKASFVSLNHNDGLHSASNYIGGSTVSVIGDSELDSTEIGAACGTAHALASGDTAVRRVEAAEYPGATVESTAVQASSTCGCGGGAEPAAHHLVFALGELGYDMVTEARKDSLWQAMHDNPYDWNNLAAHLEKHPWDAEAVTWTLRIDATPIYAIQPVGPYATKVYELLSTWLIGQIDRSRRIERISIPGWIAGSTRLTNGVSVPVVVPSLRGMFAWDTKKLAEAALHSRSEGDSPSQSSSIGASGLTNFLERVYYELRNVGRSARERAINFAATNAFQASTIFADSHSQGQELDLIEVEKSPICRQDSDCWDVKLTFFKPKDRDAARTVHRFTVDVSDVVPCTVGRVRSWSVR